MIVGDVVRWKEPVWIEKGRRRKRLVKVGERRVTAAMLTEDTNGYVRLAVIKCEILCVLGARRLEAFPKDEVLRRKRKTIAEGGGERLAWSDEAARSLAASKFVS